jgi:hypothetical protein
MSASVELKAQLEAIKTKAKADIQMIKDRAEADAKAVTAAMEAAVKKEFHGAAVLVMTVAGCVEKTVKEVEGEFLILEGNIKRHFTKVDKVN